MGRRRKNGLPIHGWVVVDKPVGPTSTQIVTAVRRVFNAAKAGHGGTLDPLASGILPIAMGEATKTIPYVQDASKVYRVTAVWGEARSTDDREGEVTESNPYRPNREQILAELQNFEGDIEQVPPIYSAIKVAGQRSYDLARRGEAVELKSRIVHVYSMSLMDMPDPDHAEFEITCGKGAYVRAMVRDLAIALGTCGHVGKLRRERLGPFTTDRAIPLDKLIELGHSGAAHEHLLPLETALDDIPALAVNGTDAIRLKRGQKILLRGRDAPVHHGTLVVMNKGRAVALAEAKGAEVRPTRVLNLPTNGAVDVDYH